MLLYQELARVLININKMTNEEIIDLINKSQNFRNETISTLLRIANLTKEVK